MRRDVEREVHACQLGLKAALKGSSSDNKALYSLAVSKCQTAMSSIVADSNINDRTIINSLGIDNEFIEMRDWLIKRVPVVDEILKKWPAADYPTMDDERSRACNQACADLFGQFMKRFFKKHIVKKAVYKEIKVRPEQCAKLTAIVDLMNERLTFEGPPTPDKSKAHRMMSGLVENTVTYTKTGYWNMSKIDLVRGRQSGSDPALCDFMSVGRTHDPEFHKQFVEEIKAAPEFVKRGGAYSRIESCIAKVEERETQSSSGRVHSHQEAAVSRLFHFFYKLVTNCPTMDYEDLQRSVDYLGSIRDYTVNQVHLRDIISMGPAEIAGMTFDSVADGGPFHKYQHPLTISAKRFANGAASVCGINTVAQILNLFKNPAKGLCTILAINEAIDAQQQIELDLMKISDDGAKIYRQTRITCWALHQLLKRTTCCADWTGEVTGDASRVGFTPQIRTEQS